VEPNPWLANQINQLEIQQEELHPAAGKLRNPGPDGTSHQLAGEVSTPSAQSQWNNGAGKRRSGHRKNRGRLREEREDELEGPNLLTERVMAAMTLGSVAFQMSLFYIINHKDHDMKRYSLSVVGQTISIFCSVLAFSACFQVVETYLEDASVNVPCSYAL
jgi:hypothetical protein